MKISISQQTLQQVLNDLGRCITSRPQLPILSCILLVATEEVITLSATDLQLGMSVRVEGKVEEEGRVAIPAKVFTDFITTLSTGVLELETEQHTLKIKTSDGTATFQIVDAGDYPDFPQPSGENTSFPLDVIAPAIQSTSFASSLDETRPILTSLLLQLGEQLEIVGTDGFRLAKITLPYSAPMQTLLLSAKGVSEVVKIAVRKKVKTLSLTVSESLKQVFFSFDEYSVTSRLLEGQYPPYEKIVPTEFVTQIVFDAEELQQKLKTASVFARESAGIITFHITPEGLTLSSKSSTYGHQEVALAAKHLGTEKGPIEISFNSRYIQDFLSVTKPTSLWFGMNDSLKPAAFRPDGMSEFLYVVMPFRVNQ